MEADEEVEESDQQKNLTRLLHFLRTHICLILPSQSPRETAKEAEEAKAAETVEADEEVAELYNTNLPNSPTSPLPVLSPFPFHSNPLPAPSPRATSKEVEEEEAAEWAEVTEEAAESY